MKEYDQYLVNTINISIEEMVFEAAKSLFPYVYQEERAVIFVGKGNNGADGLALACLMKKNKQDVTVIVLGDTDELADATLFYLGNAIKHGVEVYPVKEIDQTMTEIIVSKLMKASIVIDAILGYGFKGELEGLEKLAVELISENYNRTILSVDTPTGLDVNTGKVNGTAIRATLTITFVAMKQGFLNPSSREYTGELIIEPLNFTNEIGKELNFSKLTDESGMIDIIKARKYDQHKYDYGSTLHFTGSVNYKGATILAAKGSLYSGVGLTTICSGTKVLSNISVSIPEVITMDDAKFDIVTSINDYNSVLFGCGVGDYERTSEKLHSIITNYEGITVIDADGLNLVSQNLDVLKHKKGEVILTPHAGEMKRLLNDEYEEIVASAIEFAKSYGVTVVLKGPYTLITNGVVTYRNSTGNPAMATAGMGDVLAGIIASLAAQGYSSIEACLLGTYIHGRAADLLANDDYSVYASDVADLLPRVMKELVDKKN